MKNRFNDAVTVQYEKCCVGREEVCDFVNRVRDENPNIVPEFSAWMAGSNAVVEEASNSNVEKDDAKKKTSRTQKKS